MKKYIFTNPSSRTGYDTWSIFKRSLTGLNSEFSVSSSSCLTKTEEPSLPYYLPKAEGRIIGFIPFPRVLVLCKMQSISFRIWTRVAVFISYDDNHYSTGIYIYIYLFIYIYIIGTVYLCGSNKVFRSRYWIGSRVRHKTPEEHIDRNFVSTATKMG